MSSANNRACCLYGIQHWCTDEQDFMSQTSSSEENTRPDYRTHLLHENAFEGTKCLVPVM
jgi:hypothetical protein